MCYDMKCKLDAEEQILEDGMEQFQPVNAAKRQLIEGIIDKANERMRENLQGLHRQTFI